MLESVHPGWMPLFNAEHDRLVEILAKLSGEEVVPARANIFRAFEQDPGSIRVLILGQDPYPNPDHAMGLAFCVPSGTYPLPPSLENIFKELRSDLGHGMVRNKDISTWSQHGVMLLNRHLTTRPGETAAHLGLGWDLFTEAAVRFLQELKGERVGRDSLGVEGSAAEWNTAAGNRDLIPTPLTTLVLPRLLWLKTFFWM